MKSRTTLKLKPEVNNCDTNNAMSGKELRARINVLFINAAREDLNKASMKKGNEALLPMAEMFTTGKRIHEVNYGK